MICTRCPNEIVQIPNIAHVGLCTECRNKLVTELEQKQKNPDAHEGEKDE